MGSDVIIEHPRSMEASVAVAEFCASIRARTFLSHHKCVTQSLPLPILPGGPAGSMPSLDILRLLIG